MAAMNKVLKALNMKTGVRFTNSEAIRNVLVDLPLHIEVVVRKIKNQRSLDQNSYLWGVCYDILSKWNGDLPEYWHEYCKLNFNIHYDKVEIQLTIFMPIFRKITVPF